MTVATRAKLGNKMSKLTDASINHSCSDIWWTELWRLQTVPWTAKLISEPSVILRSVPCYCLLHNFTQCIIHSDLQNVCMWLKTIYHDSTLHHLKHQVWRSLVQKVGLNVLWVDICMFISERHTVDTVENVLAPNTLFRSSISIPNISFILCRVVFFFFSLSQFFMLPYLDVFLLCWLRKWTGQKQHSGGGGRSNSSSPQSHTHQ